MDSCPLFLGHQKKGLKQTPAMNRKQYGELWEGNSLNATDVMSRMGCQFPKPEHQKTKIENGKELFPTWTFIQGVNATPCEDYPRRTSMQIPLMQSTANLQFKEDRIPTRYPHKDLHRR